MFLGNDFLKNFILIVDDEFFKKKKNSYYFLINKNFCQGSMD